MLKKMIEFCLETKQVIHLQDYHPFFSNEELKEIHLLNSKMFQGKQSFESLVQCLAFDPSNETLKIEALSLGIKTTNIFSFDSILELKDKEWNGILNSLKEKKFKEISDNHPLKNEIETKLRLLHLTTYAGAVSYSMIKKDLKLQDNMMVEDFIILGVSNQLLKVKMDQQEEMIHFIQSNRNKDWKEMNGEMEHLSTLLKSF
jgi:hypothetical protein